MTNRPIELIALWTVMLAACSGGGGGDAPVVPPAPSNAPPTANAGPDQTVFQSSTVTLSGSGTDTDGSVTGYSWTQTSGPTVTVNNSASSQASFTAPLITQGNSLEFMLTVTDNAGGSDTDTVTISVQDNFPVTITNGPATTTKDAFAVFAFNADGVSDFECDLDSSGFQTCANPHSVLPLSPGEHSISIRSVKGHPGEPTNFSWTVSSIFGDSADRASHSGIVPSATTPSPVEPNSWRGIFRINCDFSHSDYDDPIVFPGQDGAAHLHRFYGNMLLDENSTTTSLFTTGEATCQGNELNRSAYWIPALLAPSYNLQTGQRLTDANGDPAWKVVPAVVGNDDVAHEIFYYSAGIDDLDAIKPIPLGLKMIAGSATSGPGAEQDTSIVRWHCQSWQSSDAGNPRWSTSIPECVAPDRLRMDIFFPSCWNGTDLDSADHKSHLAYPVEISTMPSRMGCPASHPEPIIRVSFHYAWGVTPEFYDPTTLSSRGWQIASDGYDTSAAPGGMSLHGDWFNAWNPEALEAILTECIRKELDCHDGNYGNGFRLSGTRPGPQTAPEIINKGAGHGMHHGG